jgi:hypothetical protein
VRLEAGVSADYAAQFEAKLKLKQQELDAYNAMGSPSSARWPTARIRTEGGF